MPRLSWLPASKCGRSLDSTDSFAWRPLKNSGASSDQ
jgi:hypothetical protein